MSMTPEFEGSLDRFSRRAAICGGTAGFISVAMIAGGVRHTTLAQIATPEETTPTTPEITEGEALVPDLTGVTPLTLTGDRLTRFEVHAAATLAELGIPGASIAVVQNGEVVFAQGFGVREQGRPEPVTPDTLLRIGSVTKSFSSLLTATLVDAGKLDWETPLVDLLPEFAVEDPSLTPKLTIADAFSAATGLPRRDLEMIFNSDENTAEKSVASIAHLPLTAPYGTTYQYNNQMVAAGGYAAAVADNGLADDLLRSYEIALRARVLDPIGMASTTLSIDEVVASGDFATPHGAGLAGELLPMPLLDDTRWLEPIAPTGALWSNAREMARYLQTELGRGLNPDGTRVVSATNLERTWQPGVEMPPVTGLPAELAAAAGHYGLGWGLGTYGGQRLVWHSGGTLGFTSLATFLPEAGLGVVTLTNGSGLEPFMFASSVQFQLLEVLFDLPAMFDWKLIPLIAQSDQGRSDLLASLGEIDSTAVGEHLGSYANADFGELTLLMADDQLLL
ncbi:MAG: serine hydrolase domain-containing protein, partial [Thermomicrobiales bacterium]